MIHTWKNLNQIDQLHTIDETSNHKPVIVFKHSTRCGISHHAMEKLVQDWDKIENENLDFYYLDLLNHRNISNEIADRYGVIHQSPQIVLIKNGRSVYDISHSGISINTIKSKL